MFTVEAVARAIDHAVLKPEATEADVRAAADLCRRRGIGCLCVRPEDIALAVELLSDGDCVVGSVVGFPFGIQLTEVKALEARMALDAGARELDMVMNAGHFLSGDAAYVRRDIEAVVAAGHERAAVVKVILETCRLDERGIRAACRLAEEAGADFVKTSTGFAGGGATEEAVRIMLESVSPRVGVKASGGIRSWDEAVRFLEMGCRRLGIGASEQVLDGSGA